MGNCQAIDNATLIVQHPCGRADKYYWPVSAYEIMKMNPGHSVALLLTTTTTTTTATNRPPTTTTTTAAVAATPAATKNTSSVRVTRIKLLRPTDTLILGQVYRLITTQEVMKGLCAKKYAKMKKTNSSESVASHDKKEGLKEKMGSDFDAPPRKPEMENKPNQVLKNDRHKPRAKPATANSKPWQPSLRSISEAGS